MNPVISSDYKIGFIGGGNMARAIAVPLIEKGIIKPQDLWVSAKTRKTLDFWRQIDTKNPVNVTLENKEIIANCHIVILAVKPQYLNDLSSDFHCIVLSREKVFVSILAGIPLSTLEAKIGFSNISIMRMIPNTALSIGEGITVYCQNQYMTAEQEISIITLFRHLGRVEKIPESQMNVAGALSGSGPAFAYLMIEALSDGAVKNGLPRQLATSLAGQMLAGAGKMVVETHKHPGQLKDEVCSPGGTTIAGIHALEQGGVRASLMNAIEAAVKRSKELGS